MEDKLANLSDLANLSNNVKQLLKQLKAQEKILAGLAVGDRDGDGPRLHAGLAAVDRELLERLGLGDPSRAAVDHLRARLDAVRREQRQLLGQELQQRCAAAGRANKRLGDNPPEFLVAPFTVAVDLESMGAVISYAREELCSIRARPEDILTAAEREEKKLRGPKMAAEKIFDLLLTAYRGVCGQRGVASGTRVELAEVLPMMALLLQPRSFRQNPVRERFAAYPKARFLYDLARLRAERVLERDGLRLDLGTATGDSAKNRARVFYLATPDGQGQYYLSLRFVARPPVPAPQ